MKRVNSGFTHPKALKRLPIYLHSPPPPVALAVALLLQLPFWLSFPKGICF